MNFGDAASKGTNSLVYDIDSLVSYGDYMEVDIIYRKGMLELRDFLRFHQEMDGKWYNVQFSPLHKSPFNGYIKDNERCVFRAFIWLEELNKIGYFVDYEMPYSIIKNCSFLHLMEKK